MRKISAARKRWLLKRSRKIMRRRRHTVKTAVYHTPGGPVLVEVGNTRAMPRTICLNKDLDGTIKFFGQFRLETKLPKAKFTRAPSSKKRGRMKLLRNHYDFEPIKTISSGAALILAAEFDRVYTLRKMIPSPININNWDDAVYGMLFHLGFFRLMGFSENQTRKQASTRPPQLVGRAIMPMISGNNADVSDELRLELLKLFSVAGANEEHLLKLCSAIIDAIENVVNHAYDGMSINDRQLIPRKWWISGSASESLREITVSIFDQGVSIPVSLPVKWGSDPSFLHLLKKSGLWPWSKALDHEAIRAAMQLSATSTGISARGKGLHKIKETMSELKGGTLKILSRKGYYMWENEIEEVFAMETPLLGTYVELRAGF